MIRRRILPVVLALIAIGQAHAQDPTPKTKTKADESKPNLRPKEPEPVTPAEMASAIRQGVDFLVQDQNKDGSWGSPERTKDLNIMAGIGSHHAFRVAVTALGVMALIEVDDGSRARQGRRSTKAKTTFSAS